MPTVSAPPRTEVRHPLDPLTEAEIASACAIAREQLGLTAHCRFPMVRLEEPDKAALRAHAAGAALPRLAFLVVLDGRTGAVHEHVVDLGAGRVADSRLLPNREAPYGQPAVTIEEFLRCERIVKADPGWRAALRRRGITEAEMELAQIDPFSSGFFDNEFERGRRILRAISFLREDPQDNAYAHPIEGVVAVVDLIENRVVDLVDDPEIVPVPRKRRGYAPSDLPPPRTDLKPLDIVQPEGPSFTVDGWHVAWQKWDFRVGFTPREGLVLHRLGYRDGGRRRSIIHRASVTEMVVPYADPSNTHYWKSAFDAGEYGLGTLANTLELGCDCLGHIHYFDVPAADALGNAIVMKNAVCMHEEDYGILWKHYEFRNGLFEVRRSRRLVISFFATVGNYDYGFFWYLYQDGTIQLEAKLTGIIQTAGVAPGQTYKWGGMVDENLGGPTHQHFFNARLHMDLDGELGGNSVTEHEFAPRPFGPDNPYGNVFDLRSRTLAHEDDTAGLLDGPSGRFWKVINPNARNHVGNPTGYKLVGMPSPLMLAQEGSFVRRRGGFATRHVWVTPYDPAEKYASGDYPNVHAGDDGLPRYVRQRRPVENADIVLWHSFGHTHVCKPEDFPVMPVEYAGFTLKPNNFFDANAANDVPAGRNAHSVDNRAAPGGAPGGATGAASGGGGGGCCHGG
ncbi:primary-amine oxidase [Roseomonas sp. NAR14]|uniref:Amine oxidase n=1 Tax=Roseomonas acroporae TaxID=2937791 RepID=A0A9X2BU37_9PROT|nr:primary-amine oxidase [Roseomonas acroporae]MCK8785293.1 primary-amine oxidase [Roseomonas acroporae]